MATSNQWPLTANKGNFSVAGNGTSGPEFYVSTTGNDGNPGTFTQPWRTLTYAQSVLRSRYVGNTAYTAPKVYARAGTYTTPLLFTQADGASTQTITWLSIDGPGQAIIDGGYTVTGWTLYSGSVYRVALPSSYNFWTLYENGVRARMARYPSWSLTSGYPCAMAPYLTSQDPTSTRRSTLQYANGDLTPGSWLAQTDVAATIWTGGHFHWATDTTPISSVNTGTRKITLSADSKFDTYNTTGSRYFVQGDFTMLDSAGEFFYDRNDSNGSPGTGFHWLYYYPRNTPIASQSIVIPTATEMVSFTGVDTNTRCRNIVFDGFAVKNTDFTQSYRWGWAWDLAAGHAVNPPGGHQDPDQAYFVTYGTARASAIHLTHTSGITIQNCHVSQAGTNGIYAEGYGSSLTFQRNWIEYTGQNGLKLEGNWPNEGDTLGGATITNHRINNMGELAGDSSGIEILQSGSNTLSYLDIHDGPRRAIWIHGGYNDPASWLYAKNNATSYFKVQRMCQDSGDCGAVGTTNTNGTAVSHTNFNTFTQGTIADTQAHPSMTDVAPTGFMLDDQGEGTLTNVKVTNQQYSQRMRRSGTSFMELTNCNFNTDGTDNGSFNDSLMDFANIGTTSAFPFP